MRSVGFWGTFAPLYLVTVLGACIAVGNEWPVVGQLVAVSLTVYPVPLLVVADICERWMYRSGFS